MVDPPLADFRPGARRRAQPHRGAQRDRPGRNRVRISVAVAVSVFVSVSVFFVARRVRGVGVGVVVPRAHLKEPGDVVVGDDGDGGARGSRVRNLGGEETPAAGDQRDRAGDVGGVRQRRARVFGSRDDDRERERRVGRERAGSHGRGRGVHAKGLGVVVLVVGGGGRARGADGHSHVVTIADGARRGRRSVPP